LTLDAGLVTFYTEDPPGETGSEITKAYFGEIGIHADEHYIAATNNINISRRIRIWRDDRVEGGQIADISGRKHHVGRIFIGTDKDGLPIMDLTLDIPIRLRGE